MERDLEAPPWLRTFAFVQLVLWAVGCLTLEAVASAGLIGCAGAALAFTVRDGWVAWRDRFVSWWPLVAFLAWAVAAPAAAGRFPTGAGAARLLDWAAIPAAAFAFALLDDARKRKLLQIVAAVFTVSCVVAGFQHFGVWPPLEAFAPLGWTRIPFHRVYEAIPGAEGRFMGGGLLFHRLKFSHVGGVVVVVFAALAVGSSGKRRWQAAAVAAFGTLSIAVFPHVRSGSASLLLALVFLAFLIAPRLKPFERRFLYSAVALVVLAGVAILVASPARRDRFLAGATSAGSGDRDKLLASGVRAVRSHPIAGVGAGQFRPAKFPSADMPDYVLENTGKAHNQFLSMAAETGIVGGALFLVLLGFLIRRIGNATALAAGAQASLAFFALLSLAHDPLYQAPFSMALALLLGVGCSQSKRRPVRALVL